MRVGVLTGGLEGMPPKASRLAGDQPEGMLTGGLGVCHQRLPGLLGISLSGMPTRRLEGMPRKDYMLFRACLTRQAQASSRVLKWV